MSRKSFDYKKWVRLQTTKATRSGALLYDYFDFAKQLDTTEAITNLTFEQALNHAEKNNKNHAEYISKARKKMRQSKNKESKFGRDYEKYWNSSVQAQTRKRKTDAADTITGIVADSMVYIANEIGEQAKNKKTRCTEPESSRDATHVTKDLRGELGPLMKVLNGLETTLKGFNIIDFTQDGVQSLLEESLTPESFNKLNEPLERYWEADEYCAQLLKRINEAGHDQEDIIVAIRTPVIEPIKFRPYKHRDLRALESIVVNWLDLVTSPVNPILGNHGERTSAIYGVIPVVNALFLQYNNKVNIEWIEIEDNATKRHKWDGLMHTGSKDNNMAIVIMEFAGGFARDKETKNTSDTKKLYRNALRVLNADGASACALQPRVFTILTTNATMYFEVLTQVDNEVYVRKRLASITLPMSYPALLTSVADLPSVFTWRDAVIDYADKLPSKNKTSHAYETVSPLSSQ